MRLVDLVWTKAMVARDDIKKTKLSKIFFKNLDFGGGDFLGQGPLWAKNPILIFLSILKVRVKNSSPIPAKTAEINILSFILWPHGTPKRIQPIHRIPRKRNMRCGTDPGFPTPGARMMVVYTNSFKLY